MPNKRSAVQFERVEQAMDIGNELRHAVVGYPGRRSGPAVAALVGCNGTKTGACKGRHLVSPGIGELWKAMQENDRLAFT